MDGVPSWIRDMGGTWWRGTGRRRAREGAYLLFKINTSPVASTLVWQRRIVKDQYVPVDKRILLREGLEGLPLTLLHQVTHGPTPRLPRSNPNLFPLASPTLLPRRERDAQARFRPCTRQRLFPPLRVPLEGCASSLLWGFVVS